MNALGLQPQSVPRFRFVERHNRTLLRFLLYSPSAGIARAFCWEGGAFMLTLILALVGAGTVSAAIMRVIVRLDEYTESDYREEFAHGKK